jgi:hypothetical protein
MMCDAKSRHEKKEGCRMPERWNKPLENLEVGDEVVETRYIWSPLRRWMLGGYEESGKQRYRVIAKFDLFDRDYPEKVSKVRRTPDDLVVCSGRKVLVLSPEGPFQPSN